VGAVGVIAEAWSGRLARGPAGRPAVPFLVSLLLAGGCLLVGTWGRPTWVGTRVAATGLLAAGFIQAEAWAARGGWWILGRVRSVPGAVGVLLLTMIAVVVVDVGDHVRRQLGETLSDVALVATVTGGGVYVLLRYTGPSPRSVLGASVVATLAVAAVVAFAAWGVLALWCPSEIHLALFACASLLGGAATSMARMEVQTGTISVGAESTVDLMVSLAALGLAATLLVEPVVNGSNPRAPLVTWWVRPVLLSASMLGAVSMLVVSRLRPNVTLGPVEGSVLVTTMVVVVALRMVVSQLSTGRSATALTRALHEKEAALVEKETALGSLTATADTLAQSEERGRLLLDSAVDGVVELDHRGVILRANQALYAMVGLRPAQVLGRTWDELAAAVPADDGTLAALPVTGEAVLTTSQGTVYLEARTSQVPTTPPGSLLLIRDVTGSKVAEQTIRTLFQFLQDRDEDRTRILQRTNAAIEAERNRIARDLHDGPIQGVGAVTLSLQAVKLMLDSGDMARASDTLGIVQQELGEEANNLRRVMSDLRPPLLEERGLVPAVRELCSRFEREHGIPVGVKAGPYGDVPADVETVAYRVAQEALTNVSKHAKAGEVSVAVTSGTGVVQVEVTDDGMGFDPLDVREFLRAGKVGLASMRERAELSGGTLTIRSRPGGGTTVSASLPFEVLATVPTVGLPEA
jgi:PAS domain S-box-containing protein